jgi:broad specificity phosphatase PhoE
MSVQRVIVMRHGDRFHDCADPQLTELGFEQARRAADMLRSADVGISAIFCSPFLRALQTAAPVAAALGLPVHVDRGFCELLAHNWLYTENPLPALTFEKAPGALPRVPAELISLMHKSPVPEYPDHENEARQGDVDQRAKCLARYRAALNRVFAAVDDHAHTVLIVGHGATADFVAEALAPSEHKTAHHSPFCVNHVSLTTLVRDTRRTDGWMVYGFGEPSATRLLARGWRGLFRWIKHEDPGRLGHEWTVDETGRRTGSAIREIEVLSPHSVVLREFNQLYLLDSGTRRIKVWDGSGAIKYEAELCPP